MYYEKNKTRIKVTGGASSAPTSYNNVGEQLAVRLAHCPEFAEEAAPSYSLQSRP